MDAGILFAPYPAKSLNLRHFRELARLVLRSLHLSFGPGPDRTKDQTMLSETLLTRDDTFLGICEALGEDLGFNANILRIALAVSLLWNPLAVLGLYAALGLVVLVSRLLFPNPKPAAAAQAEPAPAEANDSAEPEQVALAA